MKSFVKDESLSLAIANLRGGSDPRFAVPHGPIPGYSHLPRGQEGHRPAAAFIRFQLLKIIKLLWFSLVCPAPGGSHCLQFAGVRAASGLRENSKPSVASPAQQPMDLLGRTPVSS